MDALVLHAAEALTEIPYTGVDSATVPGAIDGWAKLLDRFGNDEVQAGARARDPRLRAGLPADASASTPTGAPASSLLRRDPDSAAVYLKDNQAPPLYSIVRNPDLANTFRILQSKGRDAFYKGEIAKAIVAKVRALGGVMSLRRPERVRVRVGRPDLDQLPRLRRLPAAAQRPGVRACCEMLNILEVCAPKLGMNLATLGPRSPQFWHLLIEAKKLAFTDLEKYVGDPRFDDVPVAQLNSKEYAATLCSTDRPGARVAAGHLGRPRGRHGLHRHGRPLGQHGLVHLQRLRRVRVSGVTIPGYGFLLHNRGALFSLDPKSPNVVARASGRSTRSSRPS